MDQENIGYFTRQKFRLYKSIIKTLEKYQLPLDFQVVKAFTHNQWKNTVKTQIEKENLRKLKEDLHKTENGTQRPKKKTESIVQLIQIPHYQRKPRKEILELSRHETKTLIIARYGMLECGKNYKGTNAENCNQCNVYDDENHRLNNCQKYREINFYETDTKVDFNLIHSNDTTVLRNIISNLECVWSTRNGHGTMNN